MFHLDAMGQCRMIGLGIVCSRKWTHAYGNLLVCRVVVRLQIDIKGAIKYAC